MNKRGPFLLLVIISAAVVIFFYGKPLCSPNAYMFSESGDGLKNYYTYYYHIAHDSSATAFEGMNYPYGEHTLYTDCHPIVANTLRCIGGENIAMYSIGVINFMMILSIFFTFIILYFLMRQLGIKPWFALLFSIGIGLLAPQIFRITGHLSLSYSIAIPLAWLLIIRVFKSERKWIPLLLLLEVNLFWLFIHAYLGMITIAFQMAFWLMLMIIRRKAWKPLTHILFVLAFVLPMIIFQGYLNATDEHNGRTDNPSGFFLYNAEPDDIFLPHHPPIRPLLNEINGLHIDQEWEAWSYIGLSFTIMMIAFLISWVNRLFRKKKGMLIFSFTNNFLLNISMLGAILVLLFAFAFPFKMFPGLADIIPYVKQFRATGRFAWVFYFTASVYAVYMLQQIFLRLRSKPVLAYSIVIIAGLMSIAEGLPYHCETSAKISTNKNVFLIENADQEFISTLSSINPDAFQAIIPLPFFHYGSETYARPLSDASVRNSMLLSAYTGLPQISAYLTRSSVQESKNIIQLMSPPWYKKEIAPDLKSDKDFLIITSGNTFTEYEEMIIHRSNKFYTSTDFSLYKISKDILLQNTSRQEKEKFSLMHEELFEKEGFLLTDSNAWFYYNPFEDLPSDLAFRGNGAYNGMKAGKNVFAEFDPNTFESGKTYIISAWMYNGEKDALNLWFRLMVEEYDARNDRWHITTVFPEQSEVICGDWSLVELTFTVKDATNGIAIVSKGKDNSKAALYLDDLLIRESGAEIYRMQDDGLFYNNHQIK